MASRADEVVEALRGQQERSIAQLCEWLKIPSVSTDPAFRGDVRRAAEWCRAHLGESGFATEIVETGQIGDDGKGSGHPLVIGEAGDENTGGPHVLFYGHYDVQPPDPVDLWDTGPFDPQVVEGKRGAQVVARGACDDKGQVMMFLEAARAWYEKTNQAVGGVRMTVLLEGEEESGSANLEAFMHASKERLGRCDVCLISDTGMLDRETPAITYGVRGLSYLEIRLHGPDQDLHSGLWGGRVSNPNAELCKVLAGLWDSEGRVTIPGFYDAVRPLSDDERGRWAKLRFSQADALASIGLPPEADRGESGFTAIEREWARPTAEVNGIYGGYTGEGAKTVIPSHATAKVSFRLVADQSPEDVVKAFSAWLQSRVPPGFRWEITDLGGGDPATCATDSVYLQAASRAVEKACGTPPALIKTGGSIPIAGMLKAICGVDTVFMGFGLADDRVHSPNEKFEIGCFRKGADSHAYLIAELSELRLR